VLANRLATCWPIAPPACEFAGRLEIRAPATREAGLACESRRQPWRIGLARSDVPNRWPVLGERHDRLRVQVIGRFPVGVGRTKQAGGPATLFGGGSQERESGVLVSAQKLIRARQPGAANSRASVAFADNCRAVMAGAPLRCSKRQKRPKRRGRRRGERRGMEAAVGRPAASCATQGYVTLGVWPRPCGRL
jgi:hypothetical protein